MESVDQDQDGQPPVGEGAERGQLAAGLLAILPLLLFYELSRSSLADGRRNLAEVVLSLPLWFAGDGAHGLRWAGLGVLGVGSAWRLWSVRGGLLSAFRIPGEGLLAAICLGPLLLLAQSSLGGPGQTQFLSSHGPPLVPPLASVGLRVGGSGYEELLFRLGLLSATYLIVRRAASALRSPLPVARWVADLVALLVSSLLFATFHLEVVAESLGWRGGEAFNRSLFLWRFLAGLLLGGLYRWRGLGVAGWAHALFNLSLELGSGPAVFR
jgi:membrane protease YdiL (CAAX protease family)